MLLCIPQVIIVFNRPPVDLKAIVHNADHLCLISLPLPTRAEILLFASLHGAHKTLMQRETSLSVKIELINW